MMIIWTLGPTPGLPQASHRNCCANWQCQHIVEHTTEHAISRVEGQHKNDKIRKPWAKRISSGCAGRDWNLSKDRSEHSRKEVRSRALQGKTSSRRAAEPCLSENELWQSELD